MAFFKFRKGGDEQTAPAAQPESVEVLRRRAKNRLIGSAILVLIGVIGFPLLVDQQPRPVTVELPIEIPDKNKVLPLAAPPAPAAAPAAMEAAPAPSAAASGVVTQAEPAPAEKPAAKPAAPAAKPEVKPEAKKTETPKPAAESRYVVQVGSFAEETRAREARAKLERAGFKNYTQAVETKDGKRIRVRAGPFASKAEAERAAEKIKKLDLPASVLSL
ncbi:MAG: SPOR domain-containing protein [Hylemonella sp.]|uniref:SPOR domain-containing protein n=1 Tax=Hylemonella sp. TaxID=2066020 RepID=UPI0022C11274|nr:SPOR domain-containing protein [Hylemonella sp.]MCZ8251156.1 SPOR domain-containing protein [Hylemonella sp.]